MDTNLKIHELMEYVQYDGTEWGETIEALANLYRCYPYLSGTFIEALEKEISEQYDYTKENALLEVTEETKTITTKTKELVWK
jgi:hypothetical protein